MARRKPRKTKQMREQDLTHLEGLIQELQGTEPEWRPNAIAHAYIAQHFGVSSRTAQQWIRGALKASRTDDISAAFYEASNRIADLLCEHLTAVAFGIANDPDNKNALNAAKWLLPRVNPSLFGDMVDLDDDDDLTTVGGIDQEVFDEMREDEVDRVDVLQQVIADAMAECGGLVMSVQQRIHAKRAGVDVESMH